MADKTKTKKASKATAKEVDTIVYLKEWDGKPFTTGDDTKIVKAIPTERDDIIVISFGSWKGKEHVDIRTYYETEDGWAPGKGLRASGKVMDQVATALTEALNP